MKRAGVVIGLLALLAAGWIGIVRSEPDWYLRLRYPLAYEGLVREAAATHDLDPALVAAVIHSESDFDPNAVSAAGAIGLMQLLPSTAESIAARRGVEPVDRDTLFDPAVNTDLGSWYLRDLIAKYSDHPQAADLALAAYNAGQGNVDRWVDEAPAGAVVEIPYPETRAYVAKVQRVAGIYRSAWNLRAGEGGT